MKTKVLAMINVYAYGTQVWLKDCNHDDDFEGPAPRRYKIISHHDDADAELKTTIQEWQGVQYVEYAAIPMLNDGSAEWPRELYDPLFCEITSDDIEKLAWKS